MSDKFSLIFKIFHSGSGSVICQSDGFFSVLSTCIANACVSTQVANSDYSGNDSTSGSTGDVVAVAGGGMDPLKDPQ
jgi:hypothetical protein